MGFPGLSLLDLHGRGITFTVLGTPQLPLPILIQCTGCHASAGESRPIAPCLQGVEFGGASLS